MRKHISASRTAVAVASALVLFCNGGVGSVEAAAPLPSFSVDLSETSVSGLSSGGYMAGQFHVAFSGSVVGAAIIAAGPYACAENQLVVALNRCMQTAMARPDPARLLEVARMLAAQGRIDPLGGLAGDRVYIFSGTADQTVTPPVVRQATAFYRLAGVPEANIKEVDDLPAGHGFVTEDQGSACGLTRSPFINDCDYDQAGDILRHIYGELHPPAAAPGGRLIEFNQHEFLPNPTTHGLDASGFIYVPSSCEGGEACRVHVAFHGCKQTADQIGDLFLTHTGYNHWADSNRIIVLYPQAHTTSTNPNACWDWWGYDDPNHVTRAGRQMAAVNAMLLRLAGQTMPPPELCQSHTAANFEHWQEGRAVACDFWFMCAAGSGESLGLPFNVSTLFEGPTGFFSLTSCNT